MAMLERKEFFKLLEDSRIVKGSIGHEFSRQWMDGKLSREQLGLWAIQHYYYISAIPAQFAALYARMPDEDGQELLMENLVGEVMPDAPETSHPNLLLRFARASGIDDDTCKNAERDGKILAGTRAMRSWIWDLASVRPLHEACGGIMVALEGQLPTMFPKYIAAMEKMGYADDDLEFFHVHVENDVEHAAVGLELCYRYATNEDKQKMVAQVVAGSVAMRYQMLDDILDAVVYKKAAA